MAPTYAGDFNCEWLQLAQGFGPWEMCKLGSEFNEAWLRYAVLPP